MIIFYSYKLVDLRKMAESSNFVIMDSRNILSGTQIFFSSSCSSSSSAGLSFSKSGKRENFVEFCFLSLFNCTGGVRSTYVPCAHYATQFMEIASRLVEARDYES